MKGQFEAQTLLKLTVDQPFGFFVLPDNRHEMKDRRPSDAE